MPFLPYSQNTCPFTFLYIYSISVAKCVRIIYFFLKFNGLDNDSDKICPYRFCLLAKQRSLWRTIFLYLSETPQIVQTAQKNESGLHLRYFGIIPWFSFQRSRFNSSCNGRLPISPNTCAISFYIIISSIISLICGTNSAVCWCFFPIYKFSPWCSFFIFLHQGAFVYCPLFLVQCTAGVACQFVLSFIIELSTIWFLRKSIGQHYYFCLGLLDDIFVFIILSRLNVYLKINLQKDEILYLFFSIIIFGSHSVITSTI